MLKKFSTLMLTMVILMTSINFVYADGSTGSIFFQKSANEFVVFENGEINNIRVQEEQKKTTVTVYNESTGKQAYFIVDKNYNTMYSSITKKYISLKTKREIADVKLLSIWDPTPVDRHYATYYISYSEIADMVGDTLNWTFVGAVILAAAMLDPGAIDYAQRLYDFLSLNWDGISEAILNKKSGGIKVVVWEKKKKVRKGSQGTFYVIVPYIKRVSKY